MVSYVAYRDNLKDAYLQAFDYVETYCAMLGMPESDMEDLLGSLLDTLYQAQENGYPAEKIVGTDMKRFCREYFQDYTYIGNFLKTLLPGFYRFAIIVFLFSFLDLATREEAKAWLYGTINIAGYIFGAAGGIAFGILASAVAKVVLLCMKKFTNKIYTVISVSLFVFCMAVVIMCGEDAVISVPGFPVLLVSGAYIVLYKLVQWVKRYKKYGTIKKTAEEGYSLKETLREVWRDGTKESYDETLDQLIKSYKKKNAKRIKRGKEEISPEEYTKQIRKSAKTRKYDLVFYVVLFLLCVGGSVLAADFDGVVDFVVYLLLIAVVEGAIMRFCYKCSRSASEEKDKLLARCDKEGITLLALWERHKEEKGEEKDNV